MIAQVIDITATQSGTIVVVPRTIMITKHAIASMAINMLTGKNACILMALVSHILVSKRSLFSLFISFFVRLKSQTRSSISDPVLCDFKIFRVEFAANKAAGVFFCNQCSGSGSGKRIKDNVTGAASGQYARRDKLWREGSKVCLLEWASGYSPNRTLVSSF